MENRTPSTNQTLIDVSETERQLVLFAGLAAETLADARKLARRAENQVRKLLRPDGPSDLQIPRFSESSIQRIDV
jgi:hypothetical protein